MEIHGHLGWKWWKEGYLKGITEDNIQQIKLEVIDILHFVMSTTLEYAINVTHATRWLNSSMYAEGIGSFLHSLYSDATIGGAYWLEAWADLARCVGLTEQEVMETYTQKYVLNKFRQDHGYKDGSYQKSWADAAGAITRVPREDNWWLEFIVHSLKIEGQDISDEQALYEGLERVYNSRLNQ
ncbi:dUTPase [compost metagenome]